jgi:hypothetical protein
MVKGNLGKGNFNKNKLPQFFKLLRNVKITENGYVIFITKAVEKKEN